MASRTVGEYIFIGVYIDCGDLLQWSQETDTNVDNYK